MHSGWLPLLCFDGKPDWLLLRSSESEGTGLATKFFQQDEWLNSFHGHGILTGLSVC